jgi:predicted site-specific integrase-resolvase
VAGRQRECGVSRGESPERRREYHAGEGASRTRAVLYVRMSTEHQQYSTENQSDVLRAYALEHGMSIVRTYSDGGKSGLVAGSRCRSKASRTYSTAARRSAGLLLSLA